MATSQGKGYGTQSIRRGERGRGGGEERVGGGRVCKPVVQV